MLVKLHIIQKKREMIFAPILIPTLNRYDHLRRCLESLSDCSFANETEVFVALDFPPSQKYVEGWKKTKEYLGGCGNLNFKQLHVIERDHNYGAYLATDEGNAKCLVKEICEKYDRYILTEDDNVFSPNFLEYANKGLELFENDESVFCLGGYRFKFDSKFDDNTYLRQDVNYSPWGVATWRNRHHQLEYLNYLWYRKHLKPSVIFRLFNRYGLEIISWLINMSCANNSWAIVDSNISMFLSITGMQQIIPRENLVENIGLDGSGFSMGNVKDQEWCANNPISQNAHFEFIGTGYEHFDENRKIYTKEIYWKTTSQNLISIPKKLLKLLANWKPKDKN